MGNVISKQKIKNIVRKAIEEQTKGIVTDSDRGEYRTWVSAITKNYESTANTIFKMLDLAKDYKHDEFNQVFQDLDKANEALIDILIKFEGMLNGDKT